jgi:hypothetical protein
MSKSWLTKREFVHYGAGGAAVAATPGDETAVTSDK